MSNRITAFEAKNRLGRVLVRVQAGEEITITRHGQPVAKVVPVEAPNANAIELALETFKRVRADLRKRGVKVSPREVRKWINEGRP
jgi:prevent-host-death family protein